VSATEVAPADVTPTVIGSARLEPAPEARQSDAAPSQPGAAQASSSSGRFTGGAVKPLAIITINYLFFTLTDGAVRVVVLFHAHSKNFSTMEVALMFTLYEVAGVFTNLVAGLVGSNWGLKTALLSGQCLQLLGFFSLAAWDDSWSKNTAILYVTFSQMLCGIAKDLVKLGGKSITKLVTPEEKQGSLYRLVALVTGMKNSSKGLGYFIGGVLQGTAGTWQTCLILAGIIAATIPASIFGLSNTLGRAKEKNNSISAIFLGYPRNLYILSLSRTFLFMSRDFWFEVALPYYLRSPPCSDVGTTCAVDDSCNTGTSCDQGTCVSEEGGCGGSGMEAATVGAFMALYIICYGQVQSWTPTLITGPINGHSEAGGYGPANKLTELVWGLVNILPTSFLFIALRFTSWTGTAAIPAMVTGVICFALVFGVNSSIHSYLVVKYARGNKVAQSVGFYYMANAVGRLAGTLGSGAIYTYGADDKGYALGYCMIAACCSAAIAALLMIPIDDDGAGMRCFCLKCPLRRQPEASPQ